MTGSTGPGLLPAAPGTPSVDLRLVDAVPDPGASALATHDGAEGRRALKAALAMAGSSVAATVIGLGSTKAVAAIYGPSGTAKIGLLAATYSTVGLIFGLGVDQAATKRIAETRLGDPRRHASIVRTTLTLTAVLAVIGAVVTVIAAPIIARLLIGNPGLTGEVRLISIAVALTIVAGGPAAYLHGTRQISRLAAAGPLA